MSIVLKDIPEDLRAQLEQEASANFRTLDQEALARLQRSFDLEMNTARDQRWIDESLASGPATPLTRGEMDDVRDRVLGERKPVDANPQTSAIFTRSGRGINLAQESSRS